VHANPPGDTYMPAIDAKVWRETERIPNEPGPGDDYGFTIVQYERAARHERAL
jgi:dihydrofolate reductase